MKAFSFCNFIYLFLAVLSLHRCMGASSVVQSKGYSSCDTKASSCSSFSCCGAVVVGPTASVVVAPSLCCTDSVRMVHLLSCSKACEIFLDQGSNPCLLHWQADVLPLSQQGEVQLLDLFNMSFMLSGASGNSVLLI